MLDKQLIKAIIKGILTYIPGVLYINKKKKTKSNHSCANAWFCYDLWLHILVHFKENGVKVDLKKVGEIGNGGSFGVGICALLSGSEEYYSLEIEEIFNVRQHLVLLDEIVELFKNKTPLSENPKISIDVKCLDYPEDCIKPLFLNDDLIDSIRGQLQSSLNNHGKLIRVSNWHKQPSKGLDFIFSRAVLEHVNNPKQVYTSALQHLKNNSFMLHDIEFHSHGKTKEKDGHFAVSDLIWKIIQGNHKYSLNRWRLSEHIDFHSQNKLDIIAICEKYETSINARKILMSASILSKENK